MAPSSFHASAATAGFAGLRGKASNDNPDFICQGVLNRLAVTALLEIGALAGRSEEHRPDVPDRQRRQGATDIYLYPSEAIVYPDGAPAKALTIMVSSGSDNWFNGLWQGRTAAPDELREADWLLPYFYTESVLSTQEHPPGQPTAFEMFAGTPEAALFKGRKLMGVMMNLAQLADEVALDAQRGNPRHPIFTMLRAAPIVSYVKCSEALAGASVPDPRAAPPDKLELIFAEALAPLLDAGAPFYGNQAAKAAGISVSFAGFYLRRMAARGTITSSEKTGQ